MLGNFEITLKVLTTIVIVLVPVTPEPLNDLFPVFKAFSVKLQTSERLIIMTDVASLQADSDIYLMSAELSGQFQQRSVAFLPPETSADIMKNNLTSSVTVMADSSGSSVTFLPPDEGLLLGLSDRHLLWSDNWLIPSRLAATRLADLKLKLTSRVFTFSESGEIHEIYKVHGSVSYQRHYCSWKIIESRLNCSKEYIWQRRSDLEQIQMVTMELEWIPFTILKDKSVSNGETYGIIPELFGHMAEKLNVTFR